MLLTAAATVEKDWVSSWPVAIALVGVGVLLAVGAVVRRARRSPDRRRRTWFLWVPAALCLVLGLGIGVNAYVGYMPTTDAVVRELGFDHGDAAAVAPRLTPGASGSATVSGQVSRIRSPYPTGTGAAGAVQIPVPAALDMPQPVAATWVYTPPGFDSSGRTLYPVLYLFHGSPGQAVDWFNSGVPEQMNTLITSGQLRPAIVVSVDVNGVGVDETDCLDSDHGGSQVETYIETVVLPWVQAGYPVADDYRYRAIGGMSSGGYCAMDQGLRHLDLYGTILGIMAYATPGTEQVSSPTTRERYDVLDYLPTMAFPHPVKVFMSYGSTDTEVVKPSEAMAAALQARGQGVDVDVQPNADHTWNTAAAALGPGLQFWEKSMQELAAGATPSPTP